MLLALAATAACLAETELRARHLAAPNRLRAVVTPYLRRIADDVVVIGRHGWEAAATRPFGVARLPVSRALEPGAEVRLPGLGQCAAEPVSDGWLLRVRGPRRRRRARRAAASYWT